MPTIPGPLREGMKCPHCGIHAFFTWTDTHLNSGSTRVFTNRKTRWCYCPSSDCSRLVVYFDTMIKPFEGDGIWESRLIEPQSATRGPVPESVPLPISQDYTEAANVLAISPKASAALSRRCLQAILRAQGYKASDLAREIDLLLTETDAKKAIPSSLRAMIDAIRNFGNFSAHPITDLTTLQIIDVEPEEAEWCLEIIEECFEQFYVKPAEIAARKAALDAKLAQAGKPASKG